MFTAQDWKELASDLSFSEVSPLYVYKKEKDHDIAWMVNKLFEFSLR